MGGQSRSRRTRREKRQGGAESCKKRVPTIQPCPVGSYPRKYVTLLSESQLIDSATQTVKLVVRGREAVGTGQKHEKRA